jgi:carbonic anhydrase
MKNSKEKLHQGYRAFREKYASGEQSVMSRLAYQGQQPETMVVSCCDSRVDPSLILQSDPGDLFVVRNVANIVPPFEVDDGFHGTSAALEYGVCYLGVKHLILLGHSQCGGVHALLNESDLHQNDFIGHWVSQLKGACDGHDTDTCARQALHASYKNCLSFPWMKQGVDDKTLMIHRWFFDIETAGLFVYDASVDDFVPLEKD